MSGNEEEVHQMYMTRRKFYVPKKEVFRDYRTFENHPSNYLYECDFEDDES